MPENSDTFQRILDSAQQLMTACGYNAFSYADIADQVGIRKASIHYYFPNKSDLGKSVVMQYRSQTSSILRAIDAQTQLPVVKLEMYIAAASQRLQRQSCICLCALLAAEFPTLPEGIRAEVELYFADQERWLEGVLSAGIADGSLCINGPINIESQSFLAGTQGAMLAARAHGDIMLFSVIAKHLLAALKAA